MSVRGGTLQEGRTEVLGDLLQGKGQRGERRDDERDADAVLRLRHAGQEGLRVRPVGRQDWAVLGDGRLVQQKGVVDAPDVGQQRPALHVQSNASAQTEPTLRHPARKGYAMSLWKQNATAAHPAGAVVQV